MEDTEGDLLTKVSEIKDFARSALIDDSLDDWNLAKDFGEFLVRIDPEDILGHAVLARAYRHLGNLGRAREELKECRVHVALGQLRQSETEFISPFLTEEEKLLSGGSGEGENS